MVEGKNWICGTGLFSELLDDIFGRYVFMFSNWNVLNRNLVFSAQILVQT